MANQHSQRPDHIEGLSYDWGSMNSPSCGYEGHRRTTIRFLPLATWSFPYAHFDVAIVRDPSG